MSRPTPDEYFMGLAEKASERGTCPRKKVGCIIVLDGDVIATGYNGSLPGQPHCEDVGCDIEDNHCLRSVHSEQNAIARIAKRGVSTDGATIYCNTIPCWGCFKLLVSAGIKEIVYKDEYKPDARIFEVINNRKDIIFRQFTK